MYQNWFFFYIYPLLNTLGFVQTKVGHIIFLFLSQRQQQLNVTQPQHPKKLNSGLSEPQNNINWLQI